MNPTLITMSGPVGKIDIRKLSNMEAGLAFLGLVNRVYPGITWGELHQMGSGHPDFMGRSFWDKVGGALSDVKGTITDVVSKTVSTAGDVAGSAVRLVTSEKVIDGASRIGAAYATGGQSEAAKGIGQQLMDLVSGLGSTAKDTANAAGGASYNGTVDPRGFVEKYGKTIAIVGGGGVVLYVVVKAVGGSRGGRR